MQLKQEHGVVAETMFGHARVVFRLKFDMPIVNLAAVAQPDQTIGGPADLLHLEDVDGKHRGILIAGEPNEIAATGLEQPLEAASVSTLR